METIAVVVCGDLDRSPRMCNHALSAANSKLFRRVDLIGYRGNSKSTTLPLPQPIRDHEAIHVHFLSTSIVDALKRLPRFFYLVYALLRIVIQTL
jgi:hypothetical protein